MFNTLTNDGLEEAQDRLGGFAALETNAYTGKIKAAYAGVSGGGAKSVTVILDIGGGKEYRETFYVTNKKGENFYLNKQDPTKKVPLPGFTVVDDICLVTCGKNLSQLTLEDKVFKIYDADAKKELPKSVPALVEIIGMEVTLGILKEIVNKTEKVGDKYVPVAETRDQNVTDKVFHTETKMTVAEGRAGAEKASFYDSWLERNKDKTRDRRELKDGQAGVAGAPGAAPVAGQPAAAKGSLFAKK